MGTPSEAALPSPTLEILPPSASPVTDPGDTAVLNSGDSSRDLAKSNNRRTSKQNKPAKKKDNDEQQSPVDKALALAEELKLFLFHTPDDRPFVSCPVDGHWETYAVESRKFERWFTKHFYQHENSALSQESWAIVRNMIGAEGLFDGPEEEVYVRIAEKDGAIYLDLVNESWTAVKITGEGWEVVISPVKFQRVTGMKSLPQPMRGGSIEMLRPYVNVASEEDWKLLVGWLIAAFRPTAPYPVLALQGQQGSAKSTTAEFLRCLIDPNTASLRSAPRNIEDLMIAAANGWCISLENLSSVPPWLSDALCRLSTGAAFSTRLFYANTDESLIQAARPIILNGINIGITNGDLFERSTLLTAPPISSTQRLTKKDLSKRFIEDEPAILGALLDAVACALRRSREVKKGLSALPRMADSAVWVTAAEPALGWSEGSFLAAYTGNRKTTSELALENSLLTDPIEELISDRERWEGPARELLTELNKRVKPESKNQKGWPKTAGLLSGALGRLAPDLKTIGITLEFEQTPGKNSRKLITIKRDSDQGGA